MQTLLAEQPWVTSGLLLLIAVAFIYGWMQTGKKAILAGAGVSLLLIPAAIAFANYWVTDRELITAAIERTAQAVANNDFDTAVQIIDSSRREQIASAKADLSRFRFDEARVNRLRTIDVIEGSLPPEAEVDMSVTVVVSDQRGQFTGLRVLRRVVLQFRKSATGEWFVYDYNHMPIVGGADGFSPQH